MKRLLPFIALAAVIVLSVFSCQQEPEEIRVASISLSKSTLELTVGDQASLDATISPDNATNKKIRWSSSKESVATVTPDGIVEAVSAGTAFITATSDDSGVNAKCEITVKEKVISVTGIALNKTSLSLSEGEEFTLEATVTPDNATNKDVTWTSDNEAVVTVSAEGVVRAIKAGTANITATTVDQGKSASCAVTIKEKTVVVTGEATNISCRNARLSGKANIPQTTATNLSFGVLYATSSGVLLGSATQLEAKDYDASFNFSIDTGVLEPETTYYYRGYIIQNDEVEYGETKSFKTLALSSMIQTLDVSDIVPEEATLNAKLDLTDCYYSNIEYGFELTPDGGQVRTLTANNLADMAFSYRDETLVNNTGYSYAAFVKIDGILYKAEPKTFTTKSIQASVTAEASEIQCNSATISGSLNVQSEGSFSKSAVVYYSSSESTLEGLRSNGTRKTLALGEDDSYNAALSSLSSSTSYNYVVVAKVDDVEFVSEVKSFKTLTIQASVTAEASDVQCKSATISGSLTVQSEGSFYKSATVYYSSSESTLEGLKFYGTKKTLTLIADGSYSATLSSLSSSTSYNYVVVAKVDDVEFVSAIGNFSTLTPPSGSVDLGLSVLWASCNLGASKPTEYGDYYQWAGTKDVSDTGIYLDWSNCPYHSGSSYSSGWKKYNTISYYGIVDNKTVLESMDDVASVVLGGKWRMPTDAEWSELCNTDNCSWAWTSIDGVNGYKVQSKKSGYTDNWIFLPAAGCRSYDLLSSVGSYGNYWSSSLFTDTPSLAYIMYFSLDGIYRHYYDRYVGRSVRPVSE